jgi:hypothetical protein
MGATELRTVYRGLNLDDDQRQDFMKKDIKFTAFTSTSRNRVLAEIFGNTLLIIDLNVENFFFMIDGVHCGAYISHLSNFPEEEEFLICPTTLFDFDRYEYDAINMKHNIYLKASEHNL